MDAFELLNAAPNLAFGIICLWFVQQIQKERLTENVRYASSLEHINELYIQLVEKAVMAIANSSSQSTQNGDILARLLTEVTGLRTETGGVRDGIERIIRNSAKRNQTNSPGT